MLFKLPFALVPVRDVYSRNLNDLESWLRSVKKKDVLPCCSDKGLNKHGGIEDIELVATGNINIDFGGTRMVGSKPYELNITDDFVISIYPESVLDFRLYQKRLAVREVGNLYQVAVFDFQKYFVPLDVFEALKNYDVSAEEKRAARYMENFFKTCARVFSVPAYEERDPKKLH